MAPGMPGPRAESRFVPRIRNARDRHAERQNQRLFPHPGPDRQQPRLRARHPRRDRGERRARAHPGVSRRQRHRAAMGGERLHAGVRQSAADGGRARRPLRRQARLCRRGGVIHDGLGRLRRGERHRHAGGGACRARCWRRALPALVAGALAGELSGNRDARESGRLVGGRRRSCGRGGARRRRVAGRPARLAQHLLSQPAVWRAGDLACARPTRRRRCAPRRAIWISAAKRSLFCRSPLSPSAFVESGSLGLGASAHRDGLRRLCCRRCCVHGAWSAVPPIRCCR